MSLHPKIQRFAELMQRELDNNAHKGDWETWTNTNSIITDFEYHKAKLLIALLKDDDMEKATEYVADCGNILMCLANSFNLLIEK